MNKKQQYVLYACAAVVVLMLLFPPFHIVVSRSFSVSDAGGGSYSGSYSSGYAFLFSGPGDDGQSVVDVSTLLVQWLGVILVGAILCFAFRDGKQETQKLSLTDRRE